MSVFTETLATVSSEFERRVDELAPVIAARSREEIPELHDFEAPEFWETVREITRGSRLAQADYLRRRHALPSECPPPDAHAALLAARTRVSLPACLKSYRIGHAVAWDAWLDVIETADLTEGSRRSCLRIVSRFVDAYDDRLMELFTQEYETARAQEQGGEQGRLALVRELLEGASDEGAPLGYDLQLEHVAVVARGPGSAASMRALAAKLDRTLLLVQAFEELYWGWIGGRSPLGHDALEDVARFEPAAGGTLCIGDPGAGPQGFRRSHRQAGEAYLIALRRPQAVTLYADVALEALALRDVGVAQEFAASRLRPLDGDRKLLDTLSCYFAHSQNASATAAALAVHEQTVARRLKTAEARIGHTLNSRRAELELALRIERLLRRPEHT
jgi:hypothetical protein